MLSRAVVRLLTEQARVGNILQDYAEKGLFRGFSRGSASARKSEYRVLWHFDQAFELRYESRQAKLRFANALTGVPSASPMYRDLKAWLKSRQQSSLPAHRRCDPDRISLSPYNRGGTVALTARCLDGDIDYTVRKLIAVVHELYLEFLGSGLYFDWLVETFDLDPDNPRR